MLPRLLECGRPGESRGGKNRSARSVLLGLARHVGKPNLGLGLVLSLSPKAPAHACRWRLRLPGLTCMALEGTPLSIGHPVHPSHYLRVFGGGAGAFLTLWAQLSVSARQGLSAPAGATEAALCSSTP